MSGDKRSTSGKSQRELLDELYYLRDVAGEREQRIRRLEAALAQTDDGRGQRIIRLEAELADARAVLASIAASHSWRLTAPLRFLARWFAKTGNPEALTHHADKATDGEGSAIAPSTPGDAVIPAALQAVHSGPVVPRERDDIPCLYVDATEVTLREGRTGIQRVVREILRCLLDSPPPGYKVEPVYAVPGRPYRIATFSADRRLATGASESAIEIRRGDIFLGLDHAMEAVVARAADFEVMKKSGARVYFVCNDTLPLSHPDWFPPQVHDLFESWLATIVRVGDGVLCISRATETALRHWLDGSSVRRETPLALGHFHLGADIPAGTGEHRLPGHEHRTLIETLAGVPSFLMVGTLEPRKGHAQGLKAFELLWARGYSLALVLVGLPGWMTEVTARRIRHHDEFNRRLFWFSGAADGFLEALYGACTALLAPSEGEGFGLPLVEAARHGLPILCRDIPVFREVAGAQATYFSGLDSGELANAIADWLKQHARGTVPSSKDIPWLTWDQSARWLLDVLLDGQWDEPWCGSRGLPPETHSR